MYGLIARRPFAIAMLALGLGMAAAAVAVAMWTDGHEHRTAARAESSPARAKSAINGVYRVARSRESSSCTAVQVDAEGTVRDVPLSGASVAPARIRNVVAVPRGDGRSYEFRFEVRGMFFTMPSDRLAIVEHGIVRYAARAVSLGSVWRIEGRLDAADAMLVRELLGG